MKRQDPHNSLAGELAIEDFSHTKYFGVDITVDKNVLNASLNKYYYIALLNIFIQNASLKTSLNGYMYIILRTF